MVYLALFLRGIGFVAERLCLTRPSYPAVENRELSGRQILIEASTHAEPRARVNDSRGEL